MVSFRFRLQTILLQDVLRYLSTMAGYKRLRVGCVLSFYRKQTDSISYTSHMEPDDLDEIVGKLFEDGLEELYLKAGARKFLLFDVPPKDRSPSGKVHSCP